MERLTVVCGIKKKVGCCGCFIYCDKVKHELVTYE